MTSIEQQEEQRRADQHAAERWYSHARWLSGAELLLGSFVVIGHNVYHPAG